MQAVSALTAWVIPVWLQGVQLKRAAGEKRAVILAFKQGAADVLDSLFATTDEDVAEGRRAPNLGGQFELVGVSDGVNTVERPYADQRKLLHFGASGALLAAGRPCSNQGCA